MIDPDFAESFVRTWLRDWNAHDLDALLSHYTGDVVFSSPMAARLIEGSQGTVTGQEALREYWTLGLHALPDLHFEVLEYYVGVDTIVIRYRNQAGGVVAEVLTFDGPLISQGHGAYLGRPR